MHDLSDVMGNGGLEVDRKIFLQIFMIMGGEAVFQQGDSVISDCLHYSAGRILDTEFQKNQQKM